MMGIFDKNVVIDYGVYFYIGNIVVLLVSTDVQFCHILTITTGM